MIRVEVKSHDLAQLGRAIRAEVDGTKLARGLTKEIRQALRPAVEEAKSAILSMPVAGGIESVGGEPLRATIARNIKAEARLSGKKAGARVRVRKRNMPRGFENAPMRTNRRKGWRHPVFGNVDVWVHQEGKPDWFDDAMRHHHGELRRAVVRAMADSARRIIRRV